MPDSDPDDSIPSVAHHVTVKPPPFMETAVTGWFAIMEAQFHLANIRSAETKFFHVLSALPASTVVRVPADILDRKHYKDLKQHIIDLFEQTKPELFNQLISNTIMQGKPSVYLEEIKRTASKVGVTDDLVKHKFLQAIPSSISAVLASQKSLDLQALGKLADELMVFSNNPVNVVQNSTPSSQIRHRPNVSRNSTSSVSYHHSQGVQPFHQNQRPKVCRAHLYFGKQAKWCKPWCQWPGKSSTLQLHPSSRSSSPASRSSSPSRGEQSRGISEN